MSSTRRAEEILARFPGPVELKPSRIKWITVLAVFAGFVTIGLFGVQSDLPPLLAWPFIVFFGLGVVVSAVAMLPGAGSLILNRDGFTVRTIFRKANSSRWRDTSGFEPGLGTYNGLVMYDDEVASQRFPKTSGFLAALMGHGGALPDTYGLGAKGLSAVMRQWRERALAAS
jgi:hypothetical protein